MASRTAGFRRALSETLGFRGSKVGHALPESVHCSAVADACALAEPSSLGRGWRARLLHLGRS